MKSAFSDHDYRWVQELLQYPQHLARRVGGIADTSQVPLPEDPLERVIFQERAKLAIRKVAHEKGHILMVGRPGTGKSLLASMFQRILDQSLGDYLRPREAVLAFPGKDGNHIRLAYEAPDVAERVVAALQEAVEDAAAAGGRFSLRELIRPLRRVRYGLLLGTAGLGIGGLWLPPLLAGAAITGIGAIFVFLQESQHRVQERLQQEAAGGRRLNLKHLQDLMPVVLFDPRRERELMTRVTEPSARNMKGGFRHDPYQSGNLQTPPHKRAYLGAHATAPIIFIDELKTLIRVGYMPELLEVMQEKRYLLEGGIGTGSGAADKSENFLKADNIIVACCNHDTVRHLQTEGDGAFLSRIEDRGQIIHMESAVPENETTVRQAVQYITQEIDNLRREWGRVWDTVRRREGEAAARRRCEEIFGRPLPEDFRLDLREFSARACMEVVKELRCRASDGKLSAILRPVNGIIKAAEFEAMAANAPRVEPEHVRRALELHLSLEGALQQESTRYRKDLKKYIDSMTDAIGYVVGLAVVADAAGGEMHGQPLPIHGQVIAGGADRVSAGGKTGEIAKGAAQNVRASIRRALRRAGAPYVGYEMHVEYIQAHGGVEGDSASCAMDVALVSDFIRQPVNQKFGITGGLTGDIVLAVGGVTAKLRSIMDPALGMEGACIPWPNKLDVEPLLVNAETEFILREEVPGVRIFREEEQRGPFDIYFCKTKYNVCKVVMGLGREEIEARMADRCRRDAEALEGARRPAGAAPAPV